MNELLNKISSYDIFNYLLSGILFWVLAGDMIPYPLDSLELISRLFVYYFLGLVISRVGSLVLEPILKRTSFVRFADYRDYVTASKKDGKIELLSEVNNTYRTLAALFGFLLIANLYARVVAHPHSQGWGATILAALLLATFLFSYKKQTAYITKRVEANR